MKYVYFVLRLIQWLIYLPIYLALWVLKFPTAPFILVFFQNNAGTNLVGLGKLWGTIDNDLGGDYGWQLKIRGNKYAFKNKLLWLWRNGFNYFNYKFLSIKINLEDFGKYYYKQQGKRFWIFSDGSWQWRAKVRIPIWGRYWTPFIGWGLFGPINGRCKFTCTVLRFEKY